MLMCVEVFCNLESLQEEEDVMSSLKVYAPTACFLWESSSLSYQH